MPVVGEAHIIVRAITTNVAKDIKNGFNGVSGSGGKQAEKTGQDLASKFMKGFNQNTEVSFLSQLAAGMKEMNPAAEASYQAINNLVTSGYKTSAMAGIAVSSIGALVGGLVALIGAAAGAAASFTAVIGLFLSLKAATAVAKFGMEGVSDAVSKATQAQKTHGQTLRDVREQLQQLKFDAEDAALSEEAAAIALEKAREGLARTSDLPADSRARREAELAYKQAELNYRRAKDKSSDLNKELKTGAKARAAAAARDPYANLTATQKGFAKFLTGLMPIMKTLREAVAKGFLPALQNGITSLMTSGAFDAIFNGIKDIGAALGGVITEIFKFINSTQGVQLINDLFAMISNTVKLLGPIITKVFSAFLKIMSASAPIVQSLAEWIDKLLTGFNNLLDATGKKGLSEFFITAGSMAAKFGTIFGNIFGGIIKIIEANFGPGTGGDMLLNWLIEATKGFGDIAGGGKGAITFFQDVASNTKNMLSGIGGIISAVIKMGADPAVGQFWLTIKKATPGLGEILKKANSAMPIIGEILVKIIDIVNKLTDSGAVDRFFTAILKSVTVVDNILGNQVIQNIQTVTGRLHAWTLGFKEVYDKAKPIMGFLFGSVQNYADKVGKVQDFLKGFGEAFKKVGAAGSGFGGNLKKTLASFKGAARDADGFAKKLKRAQDWTKMIKAGGSGPKFFQNASKGVRDLLNAKGPMKLVKKGIGEIGLAYQTTKVRMKIFQNAGIAGFGEMAKSENKFVRGFGKVGGAIMKHPILAIIGLIIIAFAALYMNNEKFRNQIDTMFRPALDALKVAWENIMISLQPVFVAFKGLMDIFIGTSGESGVLTNVLTLLAQGVANVVMALAPLIAGLVDFLAPTITFLINVISFLIKEILIPLAPLILGIVGAILLWEAAMKVVAFAQGIMAAAAMLSSGATMAQTAAQWGLNAALLANPITWIVVGVIALVAAIIWLATKTTFFTDIWKSLGDIFKVVIDGIVAAWNWVVDAISGFFGWIAQNWPLLLAIITGPIGLAILWIVNNWDLIVQVFQNTLAAIGQFFTDMWNGVIAVFQWVFNFIGGLIQGYINFWIGIFTFLVNGIVGIWNGIIGAFQAVFTAISGFFTGFINFGIGVFEGFINFILSGINLLLGGLNAMLDGVAAVTFGAVQLHVNPIPMVHIPRLAKGGVVNPSPGGSLVNVAEAGKPEKVTPLDSNGLSAGDRAVLDAINGSGTTNNTGVNITVNASEGMDVNALAAEVGRKLAFQMRKGAAY